MRDMGAERGIGLQMIRIKEETISLKDIPDEAWDNGGWSLCPLKSIEVGLNDRWTSHWFPCMSRCSKQKWITMLPQQMIQEVHIMFQTFPPL